MCNISNQDNSSSDSKIIDDNVFEENISVWSCIVTETESQVNIKDVERDNWC